MRRDEQGRNRKERLLDEAKAERRHAVILAWLCGFVAGAVVALALVDLSAF